MIKGIVVGFILGVIVLMGGAYFYFASGWRRWRRPIR